jgi:hypothetical protein
MKRSILALIVIMCGGVLFAGTAGRARNEDGTKREMQRLGPAVAPQPVAAPQPQPQPQPQPAAVNVAKPPVYDQVAQSIRYAVLLSPGRTNYIAHVSGVVWRLVTDETERSIASKMLAGRMP